MEQALSQTDNEQILTEDPATSEELTFSETEIASMSAALVRKFGGQAINIAAFFLDEHLELEDHTRAESWLRVMTHLDQNYQQRLSESVVN